MRAAGADALEERQLMKDIVFFVGAAAASALLVGAAFLYDPRDTPTTPMSVGVGPRDLVKVEGSNLSRFRAPKRDTITLIRREGQRYHLRITSRRNSDLPTSASDVSNLPLATDLEMAFAQRRLKISLIARSAPQNGSPAMRVRYTASADQQSDWQTFLLTPEWQRYSFYFRPPESPNARSLDFLAIWADPDGLGRGVEVQEIEFDARS